MGLGIHSGRHRPPHVASGSSASLLREPRLHVDRESFALCVVKQLSSLVVVQCLCPLLVQRWCVRPAVRANRTPQILLFFQFTALETCLYFQSIYKRKPTRIAILVHCCVVSSPDAQYVGARCLTPPPLCVPTFSGRAPCRLRGPRLHRHCGVRPGVCGDQAVPVPRE